MRLRDAAILSECFRGSFASSKNGSSASSKNGSSINQSRNSATRGEMIEYQYVALNSIIVVFMEVKKEYMSGKNLLNQIAQGMAEGVDIPGLFYGRHPGGLADTGLFSVCCFQRCKQSLGFD
jgi:hypothetical protein